MRPPNEVEVPRDRRAGIDLSLSVYRPAHVDAMHACGIVQVRGRPEHEPVDDAEHCGVRAEPEREREHDAKREARFRTQDAERVSDILHDRLDEHRTADVTALLL